VIDHGKVVQTGTHSQLMQEDGLYKRLNEMQFEYGVEV
jgi:ABC-type multidrug transport system fused ATPase/permease subunit